MNALKCRTLATKMLLWTHTPQHKQKLGLKSIIIQQRVGILSLSACDQNSHFNLWIYGQSSIDSWRTTRYDNGQSPRNKASKIQKLAFRCFLLTSAKLQEISRWQPIDKALHCDFSAPKTFFENHHNCLSKELTFFPAMDSTRSERKHSPRLRGNRHTDRQTDRHTHKPIAITLRLRSG